MEDGLDNTVVRASFSLTAGTMDLLKSVAAHDMRTMSAELRFLIRERALHILAYEEVNVEIRQKLMELTRSMDETDTH